MISLYAKSKMQKSKTCEIQKFPPWSAYTHAMHWWKKPEVMGIPKKWLQILFKDFLDILNCAWQYFICWNIRIKFYACLAIFFSPGYNVPRWEIFTITHEVQSLRRSHIFIFFFVAREVIRNSSSLQSLQKKETFSLLFPLLKTLTISHQMQSMPVAKLQCSVG